MLRSLYRRSWLRNRAEIEQRVRHLAKLHNDSFSREEHEDGVRRLQRMSELMWVLHPYQSETEAIQESIRFCQNLREELSKDGQRKE